MAAVCIKAGTRLSFAFAATLILLIPLRTPAQRYTFHNYGQAQGLFNLSVTAIAQDRQGFLWAGTQDGLFRYDGKRFLQFRDTGGVLDTRILALLAVPGGDLWIASSRGLVHWNGETFRPVQIAVKSLAWNPNGTVLGTGAKGLFSISGEAASLIPGTESLAPEALHVDGHGQVWFTSGSRVFSIRQGRIEETPNVPAESWNAILLDGNGNLWLRADTSLYVKDAGGTKFRRIPGHFPSADSQCSRLILNKKNEVVVPTTKGLGLFNARQGLLRMLVRRSAGLLSNSISCFLDDREGSAWIGYMGSGLSLWEGYGEWEYWNSDDGLVSDVVSGIRKDKTGYWFATDLGVTHWLEATGHFESWLKESRVLAIDTAGDGTLWVAASDGLRWLNPANNTVHSFGPSEGLPRDYFGTVAVENGKTVWAGSKHGLFAGAQLNGAWHFERVQEELSISHLLFRRNGDLVACTSKGLLLRSSDRWKLFTTKDGLRDNKVQTATESRDGALWIAYGSDFGLTRCTLANGSLRTEHFSEEDLRAVNFLGSDESGRIWVGSEAGVDSLKDGRWYHYRRGDGLVWNEVGANAFFADPNGSVWIGTAQGVARFHPSAHSASRQTNGAFVQNIHVGERFYSRTWCSLIATAP